jgi:hypothetical protein
MRYARGKHDEHQRPAATQTIESVADAKFPRRSDPTSIMLGQKVERVTADSKALFFKAAELKRRCPVRSHALGRRRASDGEVVRVALSPARHVGKTYCQDYLRTRDPESVNSFDPMFQVNSFGRDA